MKALCMGVRRIPIEDLCIRIGQLQLGVKHLPLEDLCIGFRQLPMDGCSFIGARQLLMNEKR
jgi:hypothetical protein